MKSSFRKNFLIFLTGISIISFIGFYQKDVRNFFYSTSQSLQKNLWIKGGNISDFSGTLFKNAVLKKENEELKNHNQDLLGQIVFLKGLEEENKTLREALGVGLRKDFNLTDAELIAKDSSGDSLLINKGSASGLGVGMPVITAQKVLVGKIGEIFENFSRVTLISHPQNSFPAQILEKGTTGVVRGGGDLRLFLEKVPRDPETEEGDLVITISLGGNFPKELLIGRVGKIKKSDIEPFQKVEINSLINIEDLETVFIITNF